MQERNFHTAASTEWVVSSSARANVAPAYVHSMDAKPELAERVMHGLPSYQIRQRAQINDLTNSDLTNSIAAVEECSDPSQAVESHHPEHSSAQDDEELSSMQKQLTISLKHHHGETLRKLPLENVIQAIAQAWYSCRNSTSNR
jgi:hypothetical protein